MSTIGRRRVVSGLVSVALAVPTALAAQQLPGLGGIGLRAGVVTPDDAKTGLAMSADLDLGYILMPQLRTVVGFNYFTADVDRRVGGNATGGSMTGTGASVGLRFDLLPGARLSPYLGAGLTALSVNADVADAGTRELLDGFYVGAGVSGGLAFALDSAQRFSAVAGARRVFVTNAAHTAYEVGVRWSPRGPNTYSTSARQRRADERRLAARQ